MEVAALAIAILSLTLAALALGWQVAAWALDGPRLRATLQHGVLGRGGAVVSTVGRNSKMRDMSSMQEQGWTAKIMRFGIHLQRGGMSAQYPEGNAWSPRLPYWLEPGESATWYTELQDAKALIRATRQAVRADAGGMFMTIETGTGKTVRTRRVLELP